MTEYSDLPLEKMAALAKDSCPELGHIDGGRVIDYETGKWYEFADEETGLFVASARSIVLELARRIRQLEREGGVNHG